MDQHEISDTYLWIELWNSFMAFLSSKFPYLSYDEEDNFLKEVSIVIKVALGEEEC